MCNKIGCDGWQQPMNYIKDDNRADGGRFRCRSDPNHTCSVREGIIFEGYILWKLSLILIKSN